MTSVLISLFKMFCDIILTALLLPICKIMKSGSCFKIGFIVSVISSTVPPQWNRTFTLCLFVVSRPFLIPDIIESPTIATAPFVYFALELCLVTFFCIGWMSLGWVLMDVVFLLSGAVVVLKIIGSYWLKLFSVVTVCIFFSG